MLELSHINIKITVLILTIETIRTEAGNVVGTENAANVLQAAIGTSSAESSIEPGTLLDFAFFADVLKDALWIGTRVKHGEEITFGHF